MFIKVWFNDKPLFLCDQLTREINAYAHHDDAVLIDEFSPPAVNSMIHEMRLEKVHAGIFLHSDLGVLKKAFWKKFTKVEAAGGLVENEEGAYLFMLRRGRWDLPKGKLDPGETLEECALREVREETGLQDILKGAFLLTTYHTYDENGKHVLKETSWYRMQAKSHQPFKPQAEEQITEIRWVKRGEIAPLLQHTFSSIVDVMRAAGLR
jgi:8-oxo-dGTP pyrophosphatase MutT (NUDIX family)